MSRKKIILVGPVYPYKGGISCLSSNSNLTLFHTIYHITDNNNFALTALCINNILNSLTVR